MKHGTIALYLFIALFTVSCKKDMGAGHLFRDQTSHFEALRVMGYAPTGGADINEVLMTLEKIEAGNEESWYHAWHNTALRVEAMAEGYTDDLSRGAALGRAFNYYRSAEFFISPDDPRRESLVAQMYGAFYRSLAVSGVPHHRFRVPYGDSWLDAVYYPSPEGGTRPLIICVNGYDSIQEEMYYLAVKPALERGYSVVTFDGPGQGSAIRNRGILMTHQWDKPVTALLDTFTAEFGVPERVVLLGNSLGGCLVTRAAAFESRIDGIACFDVCYDFALAAMQEVPENYREIVFSDDEVPAYLHKINDITERYNPGIRWAMTQGKWVFGVEHSVDVLREYRKYTITDIADSVTCDVLLLAGEEDHFIPMEFLELNEQALTSARSIRSILYDADTGGQEHCQVGANTLWQADFFSWLGEVYP